MSALALLSSPVALRVADEGPDPSEVTPGLLGFTVVALLGLVLWFLLRSMTARLRNVRFEERSPDAGADEPPAEDGPRDVPGEHPSER